MQSILVYDGACGICTRLAHTGMNIDKYHKILFIPYQDPKTLLLTSVNLDMGKKSAYALHNGKLLKGAQAVFVAMSLLPGIYGAIGHVFKNSFFSSLLEPIYRVIAHYRGFISLFFGLNQCKIYDIH